MTRCDALENILGRNRQQVIVQKRKSLKKGISGKVNHILQTVGLAQRPLYDCEVLQLAIADECDTIDLEVDHVRNLSYQTEDDLLRQAYCARESRLLQHKKDLRTYR